MRYPIAIDFETTDIDPKTCEPVEVAMVGVDCHMVELIKPEKPIPPEVSAIHHISNDDVATSRSWADVKADMRGIVNQMDRKVLVAHNASYEIDVLGAGFEDVEWVCTYKVALRLYPDAPNHKNETLRYLLGLPNLGRSGAQLTHSAKHDAEVTFYMMQAFIQTVPLETMIQWSKEPKAFPKIPFGKHRGMKWPEIPLSYLTWCNQQSDMDPDILHCVRNEITRRRTTNATPRSN